MTPSDDARNIMLRAGLHAKDALIAALALSEPAGWDRIIREVERLCASRRILLQQAKTLEQENLKLRSQAGEMAETLERYEDEIRHIAGTD